MRTTAFMLFRQFTNNLSKNLRNLGSAQEQLSTGKRITKPSDDVIATRGAMSYTVSINAIEQYKRNIDEGVSSLGFTANQLNSAQNLINRARELAVSESSDTASADTRELTSFEISNLFNELLDISNSRLKNKYIFSGFSTDTQAYDSSGTFQGDANDIEVYINDGIKAKINAVGSSVFSDSSDKYISSDLNGQTLSGKLRITTGSNNPVVLPGSSNAFSGASPEEIRDVVNAPMTKWYTDGSSTVGTGSLTIRVGSNDPVNIAVNAVNGNTTVTTLASYINSNVTGLDARIATDETTGEVRLFFVPSTAGQNFSIEVNDDDLNDTDTSGLSALHHTDLDSNLTENALGIEAMVINGTSAKQLLFTPATPNTAFTIDVDENNNDTWGEAGDTDASSGLSIIDSDNLTNSVSFFTILDHLKNSLASNDTYGVRGSINLLDGALDNFINVTADVGSRLKYLEAQKIRLDDNKISYQKSRSELEDADITEVAMDVTRIQSTLEALRISSLQSLTKSLFDFLG